MSISNSMLKCLPPKPDLNVQIRCLPRNSDFGVEIKVELVNPDWKPPSQNSDLWISVSTSKSRVSLQSVSLYCVIWPGNGAKIEEVPEHVQIEDKCYIQIKTSRNTACEICSNFTEIGDWEKELCKKSARETIQKNNLNWWIDLHFLQHYDKGALWQKLVGEMEDFIIKYINM